MICVATFDVGPLVAHVTTMVKNNTFANSRWRDFVLDQGWGSDPWLAQVVLYGKFS